AGDPARQLILAEGGPAPALEGGLCRPGGDRPRAPGRPGRSGLAGAGQELRQPRDVQARQPLLVILRTRPLAGLAAVVNIQKHQLAEEQGVVAVAGPGEEVPQVRPGAAMPDRLEP